MADAHEDSTATTIDVDLVVQQFDAVDTDIHRQALLEAIRARDVYRRRVDELMEKVAKLERGLIDPTSQRFKGDDGAQLSLAVLAELLGVQDTEGTDPETLAAQLVEQAEADADATEDGGPDDEAAPVHMLPRFTCHHLFPWGGRRRTHGRCAAGHRPRFGRRAVRSTRKLGRRLRLRGGPVVVAGPACGR